MPSTLSDAMTALQLHAGPPFRAIYCTVLDSRGTSILDAVDDNTPLLALIVDVLNAAYDQCHPLRSDRCMATDRRD